eukprot:jgi/Mesvir1/24034/Mv10772-RA.1
MFRTAIARAGAPLVAGAVAASTSSAKEPAQCAAAQTAPAQPAQWKSLKDVSPDEDWEKLDMFSHIVTPEEFESATRIVTSSAGKSKSLPSGSSSQQAFLEGQSTSTTLSAASTPSSSRRDAVEDALPVSARSSASEQVETIYGAPREPSAVEAFHEAAEGLLNDPEIKDVVRSLVNDPSVWEAFKSNPALANYVKRSRVVLLEDHRALQPAGAGHRSLSPRVRVPHVHDKGLLEELWDGLRGAFSCVTGFIQDLFGAIRGELKGGASSGGAGASGGGEGGMAIMAMAFVVMIVIVALRRG